MPQFTVNPGRLDPYKNFKFRVFWDARLVAGVSRMSALKRTTEVIAHRSGGDPSTSHKSPGRSEYDAVTLSRGVTHDTAFEQWASKVWSPGASGSEVSLKDFRKEVRVELLNEAGQPVLAWFLHRCWVSSFTALPDLDANAEGIAFESITLENEGWERDYNLAEPAEPAVASRAADVPAQPATPSGPPGPRVKA